MIPYFSDGSVTLYGGDALNVLESFPDDSVDAVVTDPPYGLAFMGKAWDTLSPSQFQAWCELWSAECLRALKPGGHLLAFGGTRTSHRLACAVEDAGFEIRDSITWLYATGFPKTRNAIKPASEPIVVGRAPLAGTVAANVQEHGTGGLNIDACRVESRWPANVVLSHYPDCEETCTSGCPVLELDDQSGVLTSGALDRSRITATNGEGWRFNGTREGTYGPNSGGASRFFPTFRYQAKAPSRQRPKLDDGTSHPTVKPLDLMRWLVRLVTPPNGTVLDPFAGSGTTLEAATLEGFRSIGIERDPQYLQLCEQRLSKHIQPDLFAS